MRAVVIQNNVFACSAGLLVACTFLTGCREDPADRLIKSIEEAPIVRVLGGNCTTQNADAAFVRERAIQARRDGVDLFAAYLDQRQNRTTRLNLAVYLLAVESPRYLEYARANTDELKSFDEFCLWYRNVVPPPPESSIGKAYCEEMVDVLRTLDLPYATISAAAWDISTGEVEAGVSALMNVMQEGLTNTVEAYGVLIKNSREEDEVVQVLTTYMKDESPEGLDAACILIDADRRVDEARAYLQSIAEDSSSALSSEAEEVLELFDSQLVAKTKKAEEGKR